MAISAKERLDHPGEYLGLIRVSDGGIRFERLTAGEWIDDPDLLRYFVNPGTDFLEPIDDNLARRLAARKGVALPDDA